nr:M56 family metallopeptidase [Planctomycetota bacterium]
LATSWQAALLVLVILVLDRLVVRGGWPRLRRALWCLVAVKLVLPPDLASPVSVTAPAARELGPLVEPVPAAASTASVLPWLIGVWGVGVCLLLLVAVRRRRRTGSLVREGFVPPPRVANRLRAACARLGLRRVPRLRLHPGVGSPAVFGLVRPTILLPLDVADPRAVDDAALDHVLLHEAAHIRRGDLWFQAAFGVLALVHWFNPLVGLARRRAQAAREVCCDLTVAGALGSATAYRDTLLAFAARLLATPPAGAGSAAFVPARAAILTRLDALERFRGRPSGFARAATVGVTLGLAAVLLPMAFDAPLPDAVRAPLEAAELDAAYAHLEATLKGDARYGCFDKRLAFFHVVRLEAARDARSQPTTHRGETP